MTIYTIETSGWDDGGWVYLIPDDTEPTEFNETFQMDLQKVYIIHGTELGLYEGRISTDGFYLAPHGIDDFIDSRRKGYRAYFVKLPEHKGTFYFYRV